MTAVLNDQEHLSILAPKYLEVYLGAADWPAHIEKLRGRVLAKHLSQEDQTDYMRRVITFTILARVYYRNIKVDPDQPQSLLFGCHKFDQFEERNWYEEFLAVRKKDLQIKEWGEQALRLGIIDPIEYQPWTRQ